MHLRQAGSPPYTPAYVLSTVAAAPASPCSLSRSVAPDSSCSPSRSRCCAESAGAQAHMPNACYPTRQKFDGFKKKRQRLSHTEWGGHSREAALCSDAASGGDKEVGGARGDFVMTHCGAGLERAAAMAGSRCSAWARAPHQSATTRREERVKTVGAKEFAGFKGRDHGGAGL
ncbi:hypothetical protein ZWY2020_003899 [Hordeum vulgare]|nr:hypothetical protein ZWY2020_003899 [Hordeum vulgare]